MHTSSPSTDARKFQLATESLRQMMAEPATSEVTVCVGNFVVGDNSFHCPRGTRTLGGIMTMRIVQSSTFVKEEERVPDVW